MAEVPYQPSGTVESQGVPDDYQNVDVSPAQFGGQVGAALTETGQKTGEAEQKLADVALHRQGMIQETLATNLETQYAEQVGQKTSAFHQLNGLDAAAQEQKYVTDVAALRQQMRQGLSPMAAHAFDMLSARHEYNAIQDINSHSAEQIHAADISSADASLKFAVTQGSNYNVAANDKRFNDNLGDVQFNVVRKMGQSGWGGVMHQDPQTHAVTFDNSDDGRRAQAVYDDQIATANGEAWTRRIHTLADDPGRGNIPLAAKVYHDNYDKIPDGARLEIDAWLNPKARSAQVASSANNFLAGIDSSYQRDVVTPAAGGAKLGAFSPDDFNKNAAGTLQSAIGVPVTITSAARTPEHNATLPGASQTSEHIGGNAWDFTAGGLSTTDAATRLAQNLRASGTKFDQIIDEGDHVHVGFGPQDRGEVLQKSGAAYTPLNVPAAVAGAPGSKYQSKVDYIRSNYATIMQQADAQAESDAPGNFEYQQMMHGRVEQKLNDVIHQQELAYKADTDTVRRFVTGDMTNGQLPTSPDDLKRNPEVQAAWDRVQTDNPYGAIGIDRILAANAKGHSVYYGVEFKNYLDRVLAPEGNVGRITDPTQLWQYAGSDARAVLTNSGISELSTLIDMRGTPKGDALAAQIRGFVDKMHGDLTYSNPVTGVYDKNGEIAFSKFVAQALPVIKNAYDKGTIDKVLNQDSPDYLGNLARTFNTRKPDKLMMEKLEDTPVIPPGMHLAPIPVPQLNQRLDLLDNDEQRKVALKFVVQNQQVSRADAEQIAADRGWIRRPPPAPPEVPRPHF